jgi:putative pyruvate formate lyase activating enzyme
MHQQVGDLKLNENGLAYQGVLIRHLVLPNNLSGTEAILRFVRNLSKNTYLNIMDQYRPEGKAYKYLELSRHISSTEFSQAIEIARNLGLYRLD